MPRSRSKRPALESRIEAVRGSKVIALTPARLRAWPLPDPGAAGDKEARGRVLIIGGAHQMPGGVILAGTAALRAGAGKLQIATVRSQAPHVAAAVPEAFVHSLPEGPDGGFARAASRPLAAACKATPSILIGPGMVENRALRSLVLGLLRGLGPHHTVVLDAGALTILAEQRAHLSDMSPSIIITPHAGEMAALLGRSKEEIQAAPLATAVTVARELRAVVALKGAETYITDGRTTYCNRAGNAGLATSGSGDTLSGLIAGFAARGAESLQAAAWAVHLHARAGERLAKTIGPLGYLARELVGEIPRLMAQYRGR